MERRLDHACKRRFTNPSQSEAGHGDAQLRRSEIPVRLRERPPDGARETIAFGHELIHPGLAHAHECELRGDEECIHERQHQNDDEAQRGLART